MTSRIRTYTEVSGSDRSGVGAQVAAQRARIGERLAAVGQTVAVMSGKGGVGKSFVTTTLATALAGRGQRVGVLDADLNGPTVPRLLQIESLPRAVGPDGVSPALSADGVRAFSIDFLLAEGAPLRWKEPSGDGFVWRGTLEAAALREMLADVEWGALDLLLVDLPPGGTRLIDLHELVPNLAGAIAVTIPSDESLDAVRRSMALAQERGVHLLAVVENMTHVSCPSCGERRALFAGDAGRALATAFGVAASVPLAFAPTAADIDRFADQLAERLREP